jgi:hypothetical protein
MSSVTPEVRAKLAKLLRLQESSNANEAANAAAFVEKICRQHGLTAAEVSTDYDPERDEATSWQQGDVFSRVDSAKAILLDQVARYFNGQTVISRGFGGSCLRVFATRGNQIQIELYFDYLSDVMERLAAEAKRSNPFSGRSFKQNFRKGFSIEIGVRLREMKRAAEREDAPGARAPGLVVASRSCMEQRMVAALVRQECKNLRSGSNFTLGHGVSAGRQAAASVGLNKQVSTGRALALPGR